MVINVINGKEAPAIHGNQRNQRPSMWALP